MPFKVGVTTGLYTVARAEELATSVRKLGYALTRGTSAIEVAGDVPHEVTETDGVEMRHMAEKQGLDLTFHGSLTVPMCIPERGDWRDAHDHMQKSVRSATNSGCIYTNFHSCLNIWLELMTYAGRKLTMAFCDHEGRFISHILKESSKLREWFIKKRGDLYLGDMLTRDERIRLNSSVNLQVERWRKEAQAAELRKLMERELPSRIMTPSGEVRREDIIEKEVTRSLTTGLPPQLGSALDKKIAKLWDDMREEATRKSAEIEEKTVNQTLRDKLSKGGKWYTEELRTVVGVIDGYHIMAHYLFFEKDPIWTNMAALYKDVLDRYDIDYNNIDWLDNAWVKAEERNDRHFKEFFYGVVGAKYLEGHMKKLLEWMEGDLVNKELKGNPKLQEIARKMQICIESPDARDPSHAGLHLLWNPRQVYSAVKTLRSTLKTTRVWLLMDFEHVATQGLDPVKEMEQVIKIAPDYGQYVLAVHSNAPNPLHAHEPLELGDERVYKLLWFLRKTGMGRDRLVYLFFERGGGKDPFQKSVEALKLAARFLEQDVKPDELPMEYYGIKGPVAGGFERQLQIIRDHAVDPMKDLLEMPEEEWTMFSSAAMKKGKKPEAIKKGELR